jgi:hypothetical protein
MKKLIIVTMALLTSLSAFATTIECTGKNRSQAKVILQSGDNNTWSIEMYYTSTFSGPGRGYEYNGVAILAAQPDFTSDSFVFVSPEKDPESFTGEYLWRLIVESTGIGYASAEMYVSGKNSYNYSQKYRCFITG